MVPSIWCENSPLTIQEAFLAGIPVVTSDIGGMAELVQDGVNGLLFKVGDPQDLQRVLRRLIAHRGLVEHLREGIPVVTPMGRHAAELEALYESVRCAKAPRR
ncbi:MAG: glycosyltransferase [Candidatus Methylomirabilis sp.]|nr:glycosyltransferase [Candidatus Methylomirabilis sp.]